MTHRPARRRFPGARRGEIGSASVLGVQVLVMVSLVTLVCCGVGALVAAHRRAEAAADLGALAGATAIQRGAAPCDAAGRIVRRNGAALRSCVVVGETVRLGVMVRTPSILGRSRPVTASALAGPVTTP